MTMSMDIINKKLYFKNGTNIARSNYDGTDKELILTNADPTDVTIDWIGRRIFWTHKDAGIMMADMNGKYRRLMKRTVGTAWSIAVDSNKG